jgi:hypothetical protein
MFLTAVCNTVMHKERKNPHSVSSTPLLSLIPTIFCHLVKSILLLEPFNVLRLNYVWQTLTVSGNYGLELHQAVLTASLHRNSNQIPHLSSYNNNEF